METKHARDDAVPVLLKDETEYENSLFHAINDLRKKAELKPMVINEAQSDTNRSVAPHYYAALSGQGPDLNADRIAMGLMAGWDIGGPVVDGNISTHWQRGATDATSMVEQMTLLPFDRRTILDPKAQTVAIGSVDVEDNVGVLVTSYEFFDTDMRQEVTLEVITKLNAARQKRGLEPVTGETSASAAANEAAMLIEGAVNDPDSVISDGLSKVVNETRQPTQSWVLPINSIEDFEFPESLVTAKGLRAGLSVTFYRDSSSPWGMYYAIVYVVGSGASA